MTLTELAPFLTGPSSALFIVLVVAAAAWKTFHSTVLPLISGAIDRHLAQIDEMATRHSAEHTAMLTGLQTLTSHVEALRHDRPHTTHQDQARPDHRPHL
jgi:hypothetical protein